MPGNLKKIHGSNLIGAAGKILDMVGGDESRSGARPPLFLVTINKLQ